MHTLTPTHTSTHCYLCTVYPWCTECLIYPYNYYVWVYESEGLLLTVSTPQASSCCWWLPRVVFQLWNVPFPWKRKSNPTQWHPPKCLLLWKGTTMEKETINHSVRWGHTYLPWVIPVGNTIFLWIIQLIILYSVTQNWLLLLCCHVTLPSSLKIQNIH